jgi:hypothetical protein
MTYFDLTMSTLQRLSDDIQAYQSGRLSIEALQLTMRSLMATLPPDSNSYPIQASLKAIEQANDRLDFIQLKLLPDEAPDAIRRTVRELAQKMTEAWFQEGEDLAVPVSDNPRKPT